MRDAVVGVLLQQFFQDTSCVGAVTLEEVPALRAESLGTFPPCPQRGVESDMAEQVERVRVGLVCCRSEFVEVDAPLFQGGNDLRPSGGIRPAAAQVGGVGEERPHLVGGVVGVLDHAELVTLGVKLVDEMGSDFHLPAIDVELAPLALVLVVGLPELPGDLAFLVPCILGRDHLLVAKGRALVVHRRLGDDGRVAVERGVGKQAGGLGKVDDVEEELAVVVT